MEARVLVRMARYPNHFSSRSSSGRPPATHAAPRRRSASGGGAPRWMTVRPAVLECAAMRTLLLVLSLSVAARAEDVVRLGNLKFAHYGAVSHMKEVCPKHGIRLEERMFAKGLDIVPGILAGEIDLAASALDGAVAGRAAGAPVFVVAGFAKGGARILAHKDSGITRLAELKGKKVGTARG